MKPLYTVIIYTPQDLNHSSYIQTGLFELEKLGLIHCKIKVDLSKKKGRINTVFDGTKISSHSQPKTSYYKLIDHVNAREIYFATDLYDISHFFSKYALENCDFIFKRNYVSAQVDVLEKKSREKIYPMGLTLGVQSRHRKYWTILRICHLIANLNLYFIPDRNLLKRWKIVLNTASRHRRYVTIGRELDNLEKLPEEVNHQVFYQVRCFPNINVEAANEVNERRGLLIRKLKQELGSDFFGGMVPCKVSNHYYKDCLTNLPTDPRSYLEMIKRSSICIYTNGLNNSPARKLIEYLSQGKCIVAEKMDTELPVPLEHGKHILFYENIDECISLCKMLLKNQEQIKMLSKNARAYFEAHVHPVQNTKRILEFMIGKPLG